MAFDTLSYARRLKQVGMPEAQAEAVAEATRDAIAADVETKADIERLEAATKAEFTGVRHEIAALRTEPKSDRAARDARMKEAVDALVLRMTIQLGGLIAIGIATLAAIIKL
jgi:hypothetical protein